MKKIQQLNAIDKPREKLKQKNAQALKDYELIAILLSSGVKDADVIQISKEIAKLFSEDFNNISLEKLMQIKGIGTVKASQILSSIELCKRYLMPNPIQITTAVQVYESLKNYAHRQQEHFFTLYLDGGNYLINTELITIGTLNQTLVHPREVFSYAIEKRCASIIVAHNHPSGLLHPSNEDLKITQRLKEAGYLLGIELLDHIIFTKEGFTSFKELDIL